MYKGEINIKCASKFIINISIKNHIIHVPLYLLPFGVNDFKKEKIIIIKRKIIKNQGTVE
jgi:hypothetical protein